MGFPSNIHLKEILLSLAILLAIPAIRAQFTTIDDLSGRIGFSGRLALLWGAIVVAAYIRPQALRWVTALLFSLSAWFLTTFEHVTTQYMTYDAFITLMNSGGGSYSDAIAQNRAALIKAAGPSLVLLLAMGMSPRPRAPKLPVWTAVATPWLATACLAFVLFFRGGDGAAGLPPSFTPIAYLALAGYEGATGEIGTREAVNLPHTSQPRSRSIVLIVDESVAGQYLDINSANGVPTPLSGSWPGLGIHNYGLAVSSTNCSVSSNVTLRYGGTRDNYRWIIATQPSVWAYARAAEFRTVFIDGHMTGGELTNFMTKDERAEIESFVQFGHLPEQQRDTAIAQEIVRQLAEPRPKFIMVNKSGVHFPIQDKYPDSYLHYRPALARGVDDIFKTGKQIGFGGTPPEWVLYRNSYRNALSWNVGAFFDTLLRHGRLDDATLIYTSDHGQNLHEDGSSGLYTHCSPNPAPAEAVVPLVVIDGKRASGLDWDRDIGRNHDRSSHFMIFPTLLKLMGYDPVASQQHYGKPLDAPSSDPRSFNRLFNARLHRQPVWQAIEQSRISEPPATDSLPDGKVAASTGGANSRLATVSAR